MHSICPGLPSPEDYRKSGKNNIHFVQFLFQDLADSAFLLSSNLASKIISVLWAEKESSGITNDSGRTEIH